MKLFSQLFAKSSSVTPRQEFPEEMVREARANPGGWVYEISGKYDPNGAVPPHAIRGAWRVSDGGEIVSGSFTQNPNFRPEP
jgi:hypothetical protein